MQAVVAVGVIVAAGEEHADLVPAGGDDPAVSVGQLGRLGDEPFCHDASRFLHGRGGAPPAPLLQKRPPATMPRAPQFAFRLAPRMIAPHFAAPLEIAAANSSGEVTRGSSTFGRRKRSRNAGSPNTFFTSAFTLATISRGVPAGANRP